MEESIPAKEGRFDQYAARARIFKDKASVYVTCIQKSSLLPTCTCCAGFIIGISFLLLFIISLIFLTLGIILVAVLPMYSSTALIKLVNPNFQPFDTEFEKSMNDVKNVLTPVLASIGSELLCLGLSSTVFILLGIISICYRLQIVFFVFMLAIFVIGIVFLISGVTLLTIITRCIYDLLFSLLLKDFDATKCRKCALSNNGTKEKEMKVFEMAMLVSVDGFKCCGIHSAKDYYKYNDNKVPQICCKSQNEDEKPCVFEDAAKGCLPIILKILEDFPVVYFGKLFFITVGSLWLIVFGIALMETLSFYLNDYYVVKEVNLMPTPQV